MHLLIGPDLTDEALSDVRTEDRASFWQGEITNALEVEEKWRAKAKSTIERYNGIEGRKGSKFSILWSNVQIQSASALGQLPPPDVRKKYKRGIADAGPVAEAIERCMRANGERADYSDAYFSAVLDDIIVSRGVTRPQYRAQFVTPTINGEKQAEILINQQIERQHIHYESFTHSPARTWSDVWWVAYHHDLLKDDVIEWLEREFDDDTAKANRAFDQLAASPDYVSPESTEEQGAVTTDRASSTLSRIQFWEVWVKPENRRVLVAMTGDGKVVDLGEPMMEVEGFYDCGKPLSTMVEPGSLIPMIEYEQYKDQAETLDEITARIHALASQIDVKGVYDSAMGADFAKMQNAESGTFFPADNGTDMMERAGGMAGGIWLWPFDAAATALQILKAQQREVIQDIYEITGISDIMRGASEASETLGAQEIKMQAGSVRMANRQRTVQGYIERCYEIDAEIIAENYEPAIVSKISDIDLNGAQVQMMRTQGARQVQISVSTESMAIADKRAQKQEAVEFASSVLPIMQGIAAFRQDPVMGPIAIKIMGNVVQSHFPDRDMAELMEAAEERVQQEAQQPPEPPGPPEALQIAQVKGDNDLKKEQLKQQGEGQRAALNAAVELDKLDGQADMEMKGLQ